MQSRNSTRKRPPTITSGLRFFLAGFAAGAPGEAGPGEPVPGEPGVPARMPGEATGPVIGGGSGAGKGAVEGGPGGMYGPLDMTGVGPGGSPGE